MTAPVQAPAALAPDPVLPRRDELLDAARMGGRLAELLQPVRGGDGRLRSCTTVRARYRPGESLRVTYRVVDAAGEVLVSARMFTREKAAIKLARARDAAVDQGASPASVVYDESTGTVFWVFPQDRKLRGLEALIRPSPALRDVFGTPWVRSELMAYTPEKAATARCVDDAGATIGFAKVQTGSEGSRSVAVLRAARRGLVGDGPLRLPDAVGYLPAHHLALFSPAPGSPLHQLARTAVPDAMAALGAALTALHRQSTEGFAPFTRLDHDRIADAGALVRAARPDLGPLAGTLVRELLAARPAPGPTVLLHGDLHPKNVLVHDTGVSLVDLDQAGAGPAAAAPGRTLAWLWCPRPGDGIEPETAAAAADALLDAYQRPPGHGDLLWYAAAALLVERAARAVSRMDTATLTELDRVLATALRWVRGGEEQMP